MKSKMDRGEKPEGSTELWRLWMPCAGEDGKEDDRERNAQTDPAE